MTDHRTLSSALESLEARWGSAAPRPGRQQAARAGATGTGPAAGRGSSWEPGGAVAGALAIAPLPLETPVAAPSGAPSVVRTGFAALDAILGPGGLPRAGSVAVRGDGSSGTTTLALRLLAEAQAAGGIAGYVDLARSFDPIEAVARGVRLEWLVLLTPASLDEGLSMVGALLQGRIVDALVLDLPASGGSHGFEGGGRSRGPGPGMTERLRRLAALARHAEALLVVIEPPGLPQRLGDVLKETAGIRLELTRRDWIRLGRDVVGQRTEVVVARNRSGPPGRRAELRILYADGGDRDACLRDGGLLREQPLAIPPPSPTHPDLVHARIPHPPGVLTDDATPPPPLASPPAPAGPIAGEPRRDADRVALRLVAGGADHPRRSAVERRDRARRDTRGPNARGPARAGAGNRPSAGA
jgi:RecA/RadA recombinase